MRFLASFAETASGRGSFLNSSFFIRHSTFRFSSLDHAWPGSARALPSRCLSWRRPPTPRTVSPDRRADIFCSHASNPVDWHPWVTKRSRGRRREQTDLSLGRLTPTCHWWQVMREGIVRRSGESARCMNATFRLDQGRPRGASRRPTPSIWRPPARSRATPAGPNNVILTPEGKPFFATSYVRKGTPFGR